jgi:hypothetical protein
LVSEQTERIPVCVGDHVEEWCCPGGPRAAILVAAPNVKTIRAHGKIVRFIVTPVATDEEQGGGDSSLRLTYEEALGGHNVVVLKRCTAAGFVRWCEEDQFAAKRFNPDAVAGPFRGVKRHG